MALLAVALIGWLETLTPVHDASELLELEAAMTGLVDRHRLPTPLSLVFPADQDQD